jgi:hypothetical protein
MSGGRSFLGQPRIAEFFCPVRRFHFEDGVALGKRASWKTRSGERAEYVWPLVEWQGNTASMMAQAGMSRRHHRRLFEPSLEIHVEVGEGSGRGDEAIRVNGSEIQIGIVVRARFANPREELRRKQCKIGNKLRSCRHTHAAAGRGRSMTLSECDQKMVAVVVTIQGEQRVLRGMATYFTDDTLGNCLEIKVEDPDSANVDLLLRESEWSGKIVPSATYGCDAVVYIDRNHCPS